MRGLWIAGALGVLAGCPSGGDPVEPDGRPDSGPGNGGLTIRFTSDQPVPGEVADDRELEEVRMAAGSVRAIGDAAPGDSRTTRNDYDLRWHEDDTPEAIFFEEAPVGLYSSVEVRLEGDGDDDDAFDIDGRALVEAVWHDFQIIGSDPFTITIPTSTELEIGGTATIAIDVDLGSIIEGINFAELPQVEGRFEIDGDTTEMRTIIRNAFDAQQPDG
jgi:hypothetical protein